VIGDPTVGVHVLECSVGDLVQGLFDDFCEWDDDFALCGGVNLLRVRRRARPQPSKTSLPWPPEKVTSPLHFHLAQTVVFLSSPMILPQQQWCWSGARPNSKTAFSTYVELALGEVFSPIIRSISGTDYCVCRVQFASRAPEQLEFSL
jgi:hypothetical protein